MTIANIKPHHFSKLVGELRDVAKLRQRLKVYVDYPGNNCVAMGLTRGAFTHWPVEQAAHHVAQHLTHSLMRQQDFREFVGL